MDGNRFYNIGYAGTTFRAVTVKLTNNYITGRLPSLSNEIAAFQSTNGTQYVELRGNTVYNHCLAIVSGVSGLVKDNYIRGCNFTGITVFTDSNPGTFQVTNNIVCT